MIILFIFIYIYRFINIQITSFIYYINFIYHNIDSQQVLEYDISQL